MSVGKFGRAKDKHVTTGNSKSKESQMPALLMQALFRGERHVGLRARGLRAFQATVEMGVLGNLCSSSWFWSRAC